MSKRLIAGLLTALTLIAVTALIVVFGRGYRLNPITNKVQSTGLLVASSFPTGAQVFVDNHLVSATNSTITLPPGNYEVKIVKDGYLPWAKTLKIQGEVVTKADALLLPIASDLRPLTTTGALNPVMSLDGTKIAYGVATASAQKQGIWILDLADRPLTFQSPARQIAQDTETIKYSNSQLVWSPDGKQIIAKLEGSYYLINTDSLNSAPQDITLTNDLEFSTWLAEYHDNQEALVKTLKPRLQQYVRESMKILSWSPDETKILYISTGSATLSPIIVPPLIGTNTQPENRELKIGKIYVYDIKEDKNFYIRDTGQNTNNLYLPEQTNEEKYVTAIKVRELQWLPDSSHLITSEEDPNTKQKAIRIMEYDNTNKSTVFAATYEDNFVFSFPSSTRIIILTTLNPNIPTPNLYAINLM